MINVNNSDVMQKEFHLEVGTKMKELDATILPPPKLQFGNKMLTIKNGTWQLTHGTTKFSRPVQLQDNTWTIVNTCSANPNKLIEFNEALQKQG